METITFDDEQRFWNKVNKVGQCWEWTGAMTGGYGVFRLGRQRKSILAHRFSYLVNCGTIDDVDVLHRCDNSACVNPIHLFAGSHKDNMNDRDAKGRQASGERIAQSKLTAEQVSQIRSLHKDGKHTQGELARMFGVSQSGISLTVRNRMWKNSQAAIDTCVH
jgi:hypothetical protein